MISKLQKLHIFVILGLVEVISAFAFQLQEVTAFSHGVRGFEKKKLMSPIQRPIHYYLSEVQ